MARSKPVGELKNIGATLAARLAEIGVFNRADLARMGPARAYRRMNEEAGKKLPVCYHLYSLEAALRDVDWRRLSEGEKQALKRAASATDKPRARQRHTGA